MSESAVTNRDVLTQQEAEARATRVSNCSYRLDLDIQPQAATYHGVVEVEFDLAGEGPLFLDHRGKRIASLAVNGRPVEPDWTGYRLTLPADALAPHTVVRVAYEHEYDHTGDGFHQFIDPEDNEEYLYSNFEPYEAHRLFPCFDQPDIKASYSLTVTAPGEWEVVANSPQQSAETLADGRMRRTFETTKRFSTYLFALVAGPYERFSQQHGEIALGLLCRRSMARHLDTDEVFTITRQGLDFYGEFFDVPYPFGKYDQIFVPEFNAGAMENVGAVTHNEFMVFRDPPTDTQRRRRSEVILHEMAHMWFGDLVTMKWWNDLWLNESFATYMAYLSMTSATRFTAGWQDFNASVKNWAYRQDQLVTTHPIAGTVADTDETLLNFDGITYGKGASVIKQLVAAIGMDGFREGMRHYFRTHAYGNATLAQFLASLEAGSGTNLQEWARLWLETASLNTIAAEWEADGGRMTRLTLTQTAPADYATLRPHRLEVGLLRDEAGVVTVSALAAHIDGAEADIVEAVGKPVPALVFPNYNDHGYAKVALDPASAAWAHANLDRVEDPLLRQLLWSSLWNMVRDQQLRAQDFLALVREKAPLESDLSLVENALGQAATAVGRYLPDEMRAPEAHRIFEAARVGLEAAPPGDAKITWGRAFFGFAEGAADIERALRFVDGGDAVEGFTVDQDMRWGLATKAVAWGIAGAAARVEAELARDPSDRGQRAKLRAETSVPAAAVKQEAWRRFTAEGYGSLHLTRSAMEGFNWYHQRDLLEPYAGRFFESLPGIFRGDDKSFSEDYFLTLFPRYRTEQRTIDRGADLIAQAGDELPVLARMLREANDEMDRAIKCRAFAQA